MRRALVISLLILTTGCSDAPIDPAAPTATTPGAPTAVTPTTGAASPAPAPQFEAARAMRTVGHLAGRIGPRLATGAAFREAAAYVGDALTEQGYDVRRQTFPVPAGDSWGVPVDAGRSSNVIATPAGFDPTAPWLLVGAHLDTVAVAPGAEDNASGVAVLLELARVLGGQGQVVLVAFGAEEPRGPGELHHFGSKHYVAALRDGRGDDRGVHLRGMVSLDRVGVGSVVPLSSAEGTPSVLRNRLAQVAAREGMPHLVETDAASDHESFADAGFLAARIGSTPYAGYHSAADVPAVVEPQQLQRVGELLSAWLRAS